MTDTAAVATSMETLRASITYAVPTGEKLVNETFGPNNIRRRTSGAYEERLVEIQDARALRAELALDRQGFVLVDHPTRVRDFFDLEELKRVYYPEAIDLVKRVSGASRVVLFDHTLRSGDHDEREARLIREPVLAAHNDYTEWSGPQRVRDLLPEEAERLLARRFAIIQIWRSIADPIVRNPLAMADARSVATEDLHVSERRYPDRVGQTYRLSYNPSHRWFYFSAMRRDEALVFKVYDSMKDGRARFVPHTSFENPLAPADAPPRRSIEIRTLAFFDEANA
ncbi:MAG: methyltransferase [Betaproteobacteria bacterium]|nr:MAG: methyltransferase [Betaproteobacteria bacterium]